METQHVKLKNGTALGNWSSRLLSPFLSFPLSDLIAVREASPQTHGLPRSNVDVPAVILHPHFSPGVLQPKEVMGFVKSQTGI